MQRASPPRVAGRPVRRLKKEGRRYFFFGAVAPGAAAFVAEALCLLSSEKPSTKNAKNHKGSKIFASLRVPLWTIFIIPRRRNATRKLFRKSPGAQTSMPACFSQSAFAVCPQAWMPALPGGVHYPLSNNKSCQLVICQQRITHRRSPRCADDISVEATHVPA